MRHITKTSVLGLVVVASMTTFAVMQKTQKIATIDNVVIDLDAIKSIGPIVHSTRAIDDFAQYQIEFANQTLEISYTDLETCRKDHQKLENLTSDRNHDPIALFEKHRELKALINNINLTDIIFVTDVRVTKNFQDGSKKYAFHVGQQNTKGALPYAIISYDSETDTLYAHDALVTAFKRVHNH